MRFKEGVRETLRLRPDLYPAAEAQFSPQEKKWAEQVRREMAQDNES